MIRENTYTQAGIKELFRLKSCEKKYKNIKKYKKEEKNTEKHI